MEPPAEAAVTEPAVEGDSLLGEVQVPAASRDEARCLAAPREGPVEQARFGRLAVFGVVVAAVAAAVLGTACWTASRELHGQEADHLIEEDLWIRASREGDEPVKAEDEAKALEAEALAKFKEEGLSEQEAEALQELEEWERGQTMTAAQPADCPARFHAPEKMPRYGTQYNGVRVKSACFNDNPEKRGEKGNTVFIIGDWGGINFGSGPVPADNTHRKTHPRAFDPAVDLNAQERVAWHFNGRAKWRRPDYVLNVGDNFYWGGVRCHCGLHGWQQCDTHQFRWIYEHMYHGLGVDGVQWLGVLGNHDYGGWRFDWGWDQAIFYTWKELSFNTGRWMTPAQFWTTRVYYHHNFSVDYFFVDTNVHDVWDPHAGGNHNICGLAHNPPGANCRESGPHNAYDCVHWFHLLWAKQRSWLDAKLAEAVKTSDWQIIVTHFPATYGIWEWKSIIDKHGIDLFISGHKHEQILFPPHAWYNRIKPTTLVISGGGGGVTSENFPNAAGWDDEYGFMDMTLWKHTIKIQAISHGGHIRRTAWVEKRHPAPPHHDTKQHDTETENQSDHNLSNASLAGHNVSSAIADLILGQ